MDTATKLMQIVDACKAGVHLTANEYRDFYQSVDDYVDGRSAEVLSPISAGKTVWDLQFYPDTPVGFHAAISNDLDELLDWGLSTLGLTTSPPQR